MLACFHAAHTVGPDGRVYAAKERDRYAVDVFTTDGTLVRVIEREFENWQRDERELQRVNSLFEVQARNLPFDITWEIEPYEQTLSALHVDADGWSESPDQLAARMEIDLELWKRRHADEAAAAVADDEGAAEHERPGSA